MSSNSVFESLKELFPQVDIRILRAISIEHAEDINEAVEFILSEVLPVSSTTLDSSCILQITHDSEQSLREGSKGAEHIAVPDDEPLPPFGMLHHIGKDQNRDLHSIFADDESGHAVLGQCKLMFQDASPMSESSHEASGGNNKLSLNINQLSGKEDESLFYEAHNQSDHFELFSDGGGDNIFQKNQHAKFPVVPDSGNMVLHANAEMFLVRNEKVSVDADEQNISSAVYDKSECQMEYGSDKEDGINIPLNGSDEFSGCTIVACRSLILHDLETVADIPAALPYVLSLPSVSDKDQIYQYSEPQNYKDAIDYENQNSSSLDENYVELSSNKNEDYNILPTSLATRSCNTINTDLLEASINDAKNSKKKMLSSLESFVSMMQEVELLEEKAKQAKEEDLVAGHDILSKVEELKQIVKQSKDENDMHAGEVYGERSILATEARELESRLLRMSEERSEYIPVSEEIFKALEARLTAAREDIAAADLEKVEKNKLAQNILKEQELLRDAIMAESQKLQEEAEENSKLREFLMDRGRVVDALQGEIAVVCEDILSLKQRVGSRMPLTKSVQSSLWSCASSVKSADNRGSPSSISSLAGRKSPEENLQVELLTDSTTVVDLGRKPSLDDWEIFENETHF